MDVDVSSAILGVEVDQHLHTTSRFLSAEFAAIDRRQECEEPELKRPIPQRSDDLDQVLCATRHVELAEVETQVGDTITKKVLGPSQRFFGRNPVDYRHSTAPI
jgi:hypothetical protein